MTIDISKKPVIIANVMLDQGAFHDGDNKWSKLEKMGGKFIGRVGDTAEVLQFKDLADAKKFAKHLKKRQNYDWYSNWKADDTIEPDFSKIKKC